MKYGFGVDVGGTSVKLGLFDETATLLEKHEIPSRTQNGGEAILPDIAAEIAAWSAARKLQSDALLGIGIGVPGPVNDEGLVNRCVNLNWGVFNLHEVLGRLTGLRIKAGNDANVAALGEYHHGGGIGCRSALFVTLGTGVGGGDRPYHRQRARPRALHLRQIRLRRAVCLGKRHRPRNEKTPCRIRRSFRSAQL